MEALGLLMEDSKVTKSLSNHDLSFVRLPCVSPRNEKTTNACQLTVC